MKPYYRDEAVTIYHGDCREILPDLPRVDLVLTDPPYNAGKDYGTYKDNLCNEEYAEFMAEVVQLSYGVASNHFWVAPRYQLSLWMGLLEGAHLIVVRRGAAGPYRGGWSDQFEIALSIGKPNSAPPRTYGTTYASKGKGISSVKRPMGIPVTPLIRFYQEQRHCCLRTA